jgi:AbrB family looped-hinge helix DNA binding protein
MSLVKVQRKGQMTIPSAVRSAVGLADGDLVDVKAARGKIILTPQIVIDRSTFPTADAEYTPEQRRVLNARLKAAEKTPLHGPFKDGEQIAAYLKALRKAQRSAKSQPTRVKSR